MQHTKFAVTNKVQPKLKPFELTQVRILDGLFKHALEANAKWLLDLEADRLLSRFREFAGLEPKGEIYGGWESGGLSGHSLGHYLTACSLMYQATGDQRFLDKVNYIVSELEEVQQANGGCFISGLQDCKRIFGEIAEGKVKSAGFDLNGGWAPWYTQHKLFNGLRDAYLYCGNEKAKTVLAKLGDWAIGVTKNLTDELWQEMMRCEYGGMNEAMADVYAITGEEKYLNLAKRFFDNIVLDPLTRREDNLTGLHGNTQIPKLIGLQRIYELTGDDRFHTAADFFWKTVVNERSYVIGGNTEGEYFHQKDRLSERLSDRTCETCNTYNMLKLTKQLFVHDPMAEMADYYERALVNHILASQNPEDGMTTYMMPLRSGCAKGFSDPYNSFWCCTGTSMENHAKYGEYIYFNDGGETLFVNLFIASELNWCEKGVKIIQQTKFPEESSTKLTISCANPTNLTVKIRHPYWVEQGFEILVNGEAVHLHSHPGTYAEITREWKDGDVVEVKLPMTLRTEGFADNSNRVALMYGPVVLCAETDYDAETRIIVSEFDKITSGLTPIAGKTLEFAGSDNMFRTVSGEKIATAFKPLYAEYKKGFAVYWDAFNESAWDDIKEKYKAELDKIKSLENRTTDFIQLGEMQPERDHNLEAVRSGAGIFVNRKFRRADPRGWFSFDMKVDPEKQVELLSVYSGTEACNFEIYVDDKLLVEQKLGDNNPGDFIDIATAIPLELTKGKETVKIKFMPGQGSYVGRVFGCRMMIKE
ncbi:MAG: glycoside hydrolase family 127 protein [Armatimonadetes bacterium]|nr:glycoside hydrolase family 127 protein [Armatimonadota bacterium]